MKRHVKKGNLTFTKKIRDKKVIFPGSNVNKQRRCDDWSPLFVAAMLGRVEVKSATYQSLSSFNYPHKGGAAPSSGGGRHQTHGLRGEDGGHGESQPIRGGFKRLI